MESYSQAFPAMETIISVMDRSLPYEAAAGSYSTPEKSDVRYIVDEFLTSGRGFRSHDAEGKTVLEIAIEGEEVVSVEGSVFHLAEGRFLIYPDSAETKRGVAYTLPSYAKTVRFVF